MQEIPDENDEMQDNMKSYLRFLGRNKLYTVIEVVGMSVALAFIIVLTVLTQFSVSPS